MSSGKSVRNGNCYVARLKITSKSFNYILIFTRNIQKEKECRKIKIKVRSYRSSGEVRLEEHNMKLDGDNSSSISKKVQISESKYSILLAECDVIHVNEIINMSLLSYMLQSSLLCKEYRNMAILLKIKGHVGLIA
jgi:hypothetical protein